MLTIEEIKAKVSDKQLTAANALNLCMVSVSQIVEYQDLNIMEQEYDAILNNLNLENISKDEELLNVLKQILDVITFFRINDGDAKLIQQEYQQKMKNALWSAVPSPALLVTTSPAYFAFSLATMVGTGYMNYRRTKADNQLEYDRAMWQLQRSAIEQLNGLRRELFSTAWKFADHYEYPDELRLTESQIRQYNAILMDNNLIRKYQRLESIREKFFAYPPFWYQLGSAANEIYRVSDPAIQKTERQKAAEKYKAFDIRTLETEIDEATRLQYKEEACRYFDLYWTVNASPLLREDQTACACALEYADLLMSSDGDIEQICGLIDRAVSYAGNSLDILQLCAIAYIQMAENEKAVRLLKILVNEEYNTDLNAQLLSAQLIAIYRGKENADKKDAAYRDYKLLVCRVKNRNSLIPWPEDGVVDEQAFVGSRKDQAERKYKGLLSAIEEHYTILFEKLLPGPDQEKEYPDSYYAADNRRKRLRGMNAVFNIQEKKEDYLSSIYGKRVAFEVIDLFNDLFKLLLKLQLIPQDKMQEIIEKTRTRLEEDGPKLYELQTKLLGNSFTYEDFEDLESFLSSGYRNQIFWMLKDAVDDVFEKDMSLDEIARIEYDIYEFCKENNIPEPVISFDYYHPDEEESEELFSINLLGENAEKKQRLGEAQRSMSDLISSYTEETVSGKDVKWLIEGTNEFKKYFERGKVAGIDLVRDSAIAVLDDLTWANNDLLFTRTGIVYIAGNKISGDDVLYREVTLDIAASSLNLGQNRKYKNRHVNAEKLFELIQKLNQQVFEKGV